MSIDNIDDQSQDLKDRLNWVCYKYYDGNTTKMAREIDVSEGALRNYMKGDRIPKADVVARIVQKCGLDGHWFLTGDRREGLSKSNPLFKDIIIHAEQIQRIAKIINKTSEGE